VLRPYWYIEINGGKAMKRLMSGFLMLLIILALGLTTAAQDSVKIGLSVPTLAEDFYVLLRDSAQTAADEADAELILPEVDAEGEIDAELANVSELIEAGVNILLLYPVDASASVPAVQAATDAGIPVVLLDRDVVRPEDEADALNIAGLVTADWEAVGADAADYICSELDGEGVVVVTQGAGLTGEEEALDAVPAYQVITAAASGIATYFADECADVTVIVEETETFTNGDSLTNLTTILGENRPDALIVGDAALTIEAIDAVRAARIRGAIVVSLARSDDVLGALEGGQLTLAIIPDPEQLGTVSVETALASLNGDEVEVTVAVESVRVDSETASQYRPTCPPTQTC
jgi:ABC-type sugar transport system substrate-binding protein